MFVRHTGLTEPYASTHNNLVSLTTSPSVYGKATGHFSKVLLPFSIVYIYRVTGGTTAECLNQYMRDKSVQVREVDQASVKFISFKATVTTSDYDKVFDSQLWPEGIRIRDYVRPKRGFSSNRW